MVRCAGLIPSPPQKKKGERCVEKDSGNLITIPVQATIEQIVIELGREMPKAHINGRVVLNDGTASNKVGVNFILTGDEVTGIVNLLKKSFEQGITSSLGGELKVSRQK